MDRDLAWMLALEELGKQYPITNHYFFDEALHQARQGWKSTSWNYAIRSGLPVEHLRFAYNMIYE